MGALAIYDQTDEPNGYANHLGLFGHKYVAAQISPGTPLTDLDGNVIQDPAGHVGFPGFDGMSAAVSLGYVAAMQEQDPGYLRLHFRCAR